MEGSSFAVLPSALVERILDLVQDNLGVLNAVCSHFRSTLLQRAEQQATRVTELAAEATALTSEQLDGRMRAESVESRLEFLTETLCLIRTEMPSVKLCFHRHAFRLLQKLLCTSLSDTIECLEEVHAGRVKVNENFDMFDLSLRRYYYQMLALFPVRVQHASHIIKEPTGRVAWENASDKDCYWMSWTRFKNLVLLPHFPRDNAEGRALKMLKFLLNFPEDNVITVYKFHILLNWFGPFGQLVQNLERYALGEGFLGLVNRIRAKELLDDQQKRHRKQAFYLIRLSRTEPQRLCVSYIGRRGAVCHTLIARQISEKLAEDFPPERYRPLPAKMAAKAFEKESVYSYAICESGYVTITDDDDLVEYGKMVPPTSSKPVFNNSNNNNNNSNGSSSIPLAKKVEETSIPASYAADAFSNYRSFGTDTNAASATESPGSYSSAVLIDANQRPALARSTSKSHSPRRDLTASNYSLALGDHQHQEDNDNSPLQQQEQQQPAPAGPGVRQQLNASTTLPVIVVRNDAAYLQGAEPYSAFEDE